MRAGELRHRIDIKVPTTTRDSVGTEVVSWTTLRTVWAAIWPLRGKEYLTAEQVQSAVTHRIRMRRLPEDIRSQLDSKCRLEFGSRTFYIEHVINPDERNIYLEFMCKEATA